MKFDFSAATCLGQQSDSYQSEERSLCGKCKIDLRDCEWLLYGKAPAGSEYWEKECYGYGLNDHITVYVITKCPNYR